MCKSVVFAAGCAVVCLTNILNLVDIKNKINKVSLSANDKSIQC